MDNASEHIVTRVVHAHATATTSIFLHIARNIGTAVTGPAVLAAPLFKASKPPTKYASTADNNMAEVVEFKEIVVTARHTHKLQVKVSVPKKTEPQQLAFSSKVAAAIPIAGGGGAAAAATAAVSNMDLVDDAETNIRKAETAPPPPGPKIDVSVLWSNALSSIVTVDPIFDTAPNADDENVPAAVFTVMFLCPNKDAKGEELPPALNALQADTFNDEKAADEKEETVAAATAAAAAAAGDKKSKDKAVEKKKASKAKQIDDLVAAMTKQRTAFEWAMLALRRATEQAMSGGEALHVRSVFQKMNKPSLRCRAYLVPSTLGGKAQRDEFVAVYRAAIQNYWHERLESSVIAAPEIFQWCCWAQYAGPQRPTRLDQDNHEALPSESMCLLALSTQRLYMINAKEANILAAENVKLASTAARAADVATVTAVELSSYRLQLDFNKKAFAFLHFLCAQHASDFVLELQRVFQTLRGEQAEFPIMT